MPFEDILALLGAGAVLPIFLVAFWKADDALSQTLRKDISNWLLRANVPLPNRPWLNAVNGIFTNVFGKSHLSLRCVLVSYLVSISASFVIFYIVTTWLDSVIAPNFSKFRWPSGSRLIALISMIILINPVADFLNLLLSRKALVWLESSKTLISTIAVVALISVAPLVLSVISLLVGMAMIEMFLGSSNSFENFLANMAYLPSSRLGSMFSYGMALTLLLTTFITTSWVWGALIGTFVVRVLSSSRTIYAYLTYALPIDDKPVRSIGLFLQLWLEFCL